MLYAEIARRRAEPDLEQRDDVFSALLLAEDEDGERLSDREVRDELVTLLLAGHETTATGLAWTLRPAAARRRRATSARAEGDDAYLDAVVKESLRLRPVIPGVGRVVRGEPFRLNGYEIPPGIEINPSIRVDPPPRRPVPGARRVPPERFLGADAPDTYTWIPFGGGTRRCLGASFALMEMRIVLARVLERAALRAADPRAGQGPVPRDHARAEGRRARDPGPAAAAAKIRRLARAGRVADDREVGQPLDRREIVGVHRDRPAAPAAAVRATDASRPSRSPGSAR